MPQQLILNKPRIDTRGCLRVEGNATRAGVFEYYIDKKIQGVYRSEEEVLSEASLKGLIGAGITIDHPKNDVSAQDYKKNEVVGIVLDAKPAPPFVYIDVMFYDAKSVASAIADGYRELSCGYKAKLVKNQGFYDNLEHSYEQKNIIYNHVSLVKEGRAGSDVRLFLDSKEMEVSDKSSVSTINDDVFAIIADIKDKLILESNSINTDVIMHEIIIDGLTYKTEDANLVKSVNGLISKLNDIPASKEEIVKMQKISDAAIATEARLTLENSELKSQVESLLNDSKAKQDEIEESIRTWLAVLPELGEKHLDAAIPLQQVKRDYIQKKMPDLRKDISDELVAELFTLVQAKDAKEPSISPVEKLLSTTKVEVKTIEDSKDDTISFSDRMAAKRLQRAKEASK